MEIAIITEDGKPAVVQISGDIDGRTAPEALQTIGPLIVDGARIALDMTNVRYMSSAGLRFLLSVYRQIGAKKGKIVLIGLSDDIKDTMSATGFLGYFTIEATLDAGLAALAQ
jgi:anti-sigma B factor antagonist